MRPEVIDQARRALLADLTERLDQAALDACARERVDAELGELLDAVLVRLDGFSYERDTRSVSAAAEFALVGMWPLILQRLGPLLCTDLDDARRVQMALTVSPAAISRDRMRLGARYASAARARRLRGSAGCGAAATWRGGQVV